MQRMLKVKIKHIGVWMCVMMVTLSFFQFPSIGEAANLSNGMSAVDLLGAGSPSDFTVNTAGTTDQALKTPYGSPIIDTTNHYLFTVEPYNPGFSAFNNRILVWGLDSDNNLMDHTADYVIGQPNFTATGRSVTNSTFYGGFNIDIDKARSLLFVADTGGRRVLIFDYSAGFTNGMPASYVLGQPDFTTSVESITQSGLDQPRDVSYDSLNQRLYVADATRVLIYDARPPGSPATDICGNGTSTTGLVSAMNASCVLGQDVFTTEVAQTTIDGVSSLGELFFDIETSRLYVADAGNLRTLVWDLSSGITNGMDAWRVLGQDDFVTASSGGVTAGTFSTLLSSFALDTANDHLYVSDSLNHRILIFDVADITNGEDAVFVLGQNDFVSNTANKDGSVGADGMNAPIGLSFENTSKKLYVADAFNNRVLIFDMTAEAAASSRSYVHPPLCTAMITPSTISVGEEATLSWRVTWPTSRQNNYYVRVPKEGLFGDSVQSISITPEASSTYRIATFNLFGANMCDASVTVVDKEGVEVTSQNNLLSAGVSNAPFVKKIISFLSSLFR